VQIRLSGILSAGRELILLAYFVAVHAVNDVCTRAVWIARQSTGHIVAMDGPGDPVVATGDIIFIAEVAPSGGPDTGAKRRNQRRMDDFP
jgi:hypothetical protein